MEGLIKKIFSTILISSLLYIPTTINKENPLKIQPKNCFAENYNKNQNFNTSKNPNLNIYQNTPNYLLSMNNPIQFPLLLIGNDFNSKNKSKEESKNEYAPKTKPEDWLLSRIYLNSIMGISYILEFIKRTKLTYSIGERSSIRYKDRTVQLTRNYGFVKMNFSIGFNDPFFTSGSSAKLEKILKLSAETSYNNTQVYVEVEKGEFENKLNFKFGKILDDLYLYE